MFVKVFLAGFDDKRDRSLAYIFQAANISKERPSKLNKVEILGESVCIS